MPVGAAATAGVNAERSALTHPVMALTHPVRARGHAARTQGELGPGRNRTATAEGEGFTDPWAHHLPDRPTMVEMRGLEPLASAMRTRRSSS